MSRAGGRLPEWPARSGCGFCNLSPPNDRQPPTQPSPSGGEGSDGAIDPTRSVPTGREPYEERSTSPRIHEARQGIEPDLATFKLLVSYDGTDYHGWAMQPGLPTIQRSLAEAVKAVTGVDLVPQAAGRTDSGVHALGQVVGLRLVAKLAPATLKKALNATLPETIRVLECQRVADEFDPTRHAIGKHYRYVLHDGPDREIFLRRYCWDLHGRLDVAAMQAAAGHLLGTHDFRCFETEWPNRASSVRTVTRLDLTRVGPWLHLDAEADGFLYNMVRTIVGSLVEVGKGRKEPAWMRQVLQSGDRRQAGPTAPARGLFLVRVDYPPE